MVGSVLGGSGSSAGRQDGDRDSENPDIPGAQMTDEIAVPAWLVMLIAINALLDLYVAFAAALS
jgi:hypothetical protein